MVSTTCARAPRASRSLTRAGLLHRHASALDRSLQNSSRVDPTNFEKQARTWLQGLAYAAALLSGFATWCNSASAEEHMQPSAAGNQVSAACASSVRLRAVQYDPNHDERSFAMFAGAPRSQLRRGARVAGYAIERIERGAVVLASQTQRCTVRLRGAVAERALRAIPVDEVRGRTRAPLVTSVSTENKLGT